MFTTPPEFVGVPKATLQAWLTQVQQAIQDLSTGGKLEVASYAQGDGNRSVTYRAADSGRLRQLIRDLQAALGTRTRRAIGVRFA